jgi:hypothetical protein
MTRWYLKSSFLFSVDTNMLSTDNASVTSENNQVTYPLKDEKPPVKAEDQLSQEQDKSKLDDATALATLTESRKFDNIANFRDVGLSCTTRVEEGIQRYGIAI